MSECNCALCVRQRRWRSAIFGEDLAVKEDAYSEILDLLYDLEMDKDYETAILDGSWPNAIKIIEKRIADLTELLNDPRFKPVQKSD